MANSYKFEKNIPNGKIVAVVARRPSGECVDGTISFEPSPSLVNSLFGLRGPVVMFNGHVSEGSLLPLMDEGVSVLCEMVGDGSCKLMELAARLDISEFWRIMEERGYKNASGL